jgi:hypothetical protein
VSGTDTEDVAHGRDLGTRRWLDSFFRPTVYAMRVTER